MQGTIQTVVKTVVKAGDWLAKIAEEHGTTVGAIWNHPLNAEIRSKRTPDRIFPGDVFHIPALVPAEQPAPPLPEPPAAPLPTGPPDMMLGSVAGPGLYAFHIHKSPGFFPYKTGSVPSVGDNYVLWHRDKKERHHTGIVVESSPVRHAIWYTADGGQRDIMTPLELNSAGKAKREPTPASDEAAFIVPRIFGDEAGVGKLGNLHRWPSAPRPTGFHI